MPIKKRTREGQREGRDHLNKAKGGERERERENAFDSEVSTSWEREWTTSAIINLL